ncbi:MULTISPECIES: acyl-CoA dehydrogenase family protein [Agrobacterium tumefaciens complex]|jgi:alkylation response protein AidB-like acyl-CoA dehydrogenase|uniref:acyl-CoA dehydrogenase family protein n=1 Tax=Agrobacterium tumefaciens TaxID=358 RepID=UPI000FE27E00|nr:acyl-CoA dehydrogenase family protein [Agrobacterium tumefaciens]QAB00896.1 acyl-CoA dehydrogenase [Agrobacterium tumefaciens]
MSFVLPRDLTDWLSLSAEAIDLGELPADLILPRLAQAGLPRIGVPQALGGLGGDVVDAVQAVAAVAQESLAAAFMLWGHRCFIEFLLQSANTPLREKLSPDLLAGRVAGASGLSNVMKFLAGLEPLQVTARSDGDELVVDGKLPWVTNLRPRGFHVAAAADRAEGGPALIVSFAHDDPGLTRTTDLALMGMRSSDTAAVTLSGVRIPRDRIIAENAQEWLPGVRPTFIGLQCGMAIGLARRSLTEAAACGGAGRDVLAPSLEETDERLRQIETQLAAGLRSGAFVAKPVPLFELRIELAEVVAEAVALELQAAGGRCYLREPGRAFARRWRESAFIPLITPSLVQLRTVLAAAKKAA